MKHSLLLPVIIIFAAGLLCAHPVQAQKQIVYAALHSENNVAVIDPEAGKIVQRIQVGREPDVVLLNSDNSRLYVSNTGDITVSIVSIAENRVAQVLRLPVNRRNIYAGTMARTPDGMKIFVAERAENNEDLRIYVIDTKKENIVAQFDAGKNINSLSVSHDGRKLFVVNKGTGIVVFDVETYKKVADVAPMKAAVENLFYCACSPTGPKAYVSYGPANKLQVVNTDTYKTEGEIPMPKYKTGQQRDIAFSPDGKYAFVINWKVDLKEVDGLNVVDVAKNEVVKIFNSGVVSRGMVMAPDNKTFYCAADLLKWYNMLTLEHIRSISLQTALAGIAVITK